MCGVYIIDCLHLDSTKIMLHNINIHSLTSAMASPRASAHFSYVAALCDSHFESGFWFYYYLVDYALLCLLSNMNIILCVSLSSKVFVRHHKCPEKIGRAHV